MIKICTLCKIDKNITEFGKRNKRKCGYRSQCKVCDKEYKIKNRNIILLQSKLYDIKNKDHKKELAKIHREKNIEKFRLKSKHYNELNREYTKVWREKNKEHLKEYRQIHKKRFQNKEIERMRIDPLFKLRKNLRIRLYHALKSNLKNGSAVKDLGCSLEELKQHLESKFQPGMTWENYNFYGWHIDHIVPLILFDLTNREQLLKACHYTNLQPLWASDNLKKGSKIA